MTQVTFGGSDQESLAGFAIDRQGNYYVAGTTASLDLPVTVLQRHPGGAYLYRFRGAARTPLYPSSTAPITTVAADPSHPGHLYAAFARGISKSSDGGNTWQRLDAEWPANADCTHIVVSPNGGAVYVLCGGASYRNFAPQYFFRSTDAGVTWNRIVIQGEELLNLAVDPFNPQSLWAAGYVNGGDFLRFYYGFHSADGGETWTRRDPSFVQFAFDARHAGISYAAGFDGVYRTDNSGETWTKLTNPSPAPQVNLDSSGLSIEVLPSGDVLLVIGNMLHRTRDNGATWQSYPLPGSGTPCNNFGALDSALSVDRQTGSVYLAMCGSPQSAMYRSDDAGGTWTRVNPTGLPNLTGHALSSSPAGSDLFVTVRKSSDAFVAKLSPSGDLIWSTFLGGVHDEAATGLALDSENNVYLIGTTYSDDFRFSGAPLATAAPAVSTGPKSFIAKLSPDGTQLLYSAVFAYDGTARGIAVDSSGAVYITGNAGPSLPTTPGTIRPYAIGAGPNPFALKLDVSGSRVVYGTYLAEDSYNSNDNPLFPNAKIQILANAITVDSDRNAYIGGTYIWKLNADATGLVFSTKLDGGMVSAVALDAGKNLHVGGAANTATFFTTPDAFQSYVLPTGCGLALNLGGPAACWANPGFVTKYNADASLITYSTYLGGDGWDVTRSLAIGADGKAYAAGLTSSRSFPTRLPVEGPVLPLFARSGFVTALTPDGTDIVLSTYVSGGRTLEPIAVALDPAGNPVLAGYGIGPSGYGGNDVATPASDVLIFRLDYSQAGSLQLRLDAILNAASRIGTPLAPGQRMALRGSGFGQDSQVCFNGECVNPLAVSSDEIIAEPPASLPRSGPVRVSILLADGSRSNEVTMAAGPPELSLYSADNSGTGPVLALNEDGTLTSASNPAQRGTVVTLPANGVDGSAQIALGPFGGFVNASVSMGTFPGLPGQVPLIKGTVDSNLAANVTALPLLGSTSPGHIPVILQIGPRQQPQ